MVPGVGSDSLQGFVVLHLQTTGCNGSGRVSDSLQGFVVSALTDYRVQWLRACL